MTSLTDRKSRFLMTTNDPVQAQYEALPYPARDPGDERVRLARTWLDDLPMLNHYCFAGRRSFRSGFRVLVAGGGTGDGTVFLAEQLRGADAEVVHLDFSRASLDIAQRRAEVRGLANIRWVHDSLLNLPRLALGKFDYINCSGVLHHLADPDEGLRALLGALADDGAIGLLLYGSVGRTGVYQMQELLRLAIGDEPPIPTRIAEAKQILQSAPRTNWFRRGEELFSDHRENDAGLFDLLLHPRDRGYTVEELFAWLADGHGLHLEFSDVQRGRSAYLPHLQWGPRPPALVEKVRRLPPRRQYAIAELLTGTIQTHSFYATRGARAAPYGDATYAPFFFHEPITGPELAQFLAQGRGQPVTLDHVHSGISAAVNPGRYRQAILRHIDGSATWHEIFERVRAHPEHGGLPPTDAELFEDFRGLYELLNAIDRLLLRHGSVEPPRPV